MKNSLLPKPSVAILGASLDVGNRGVVALGASLAGLVSRLRPDAGIVFHYGHKHAGSRLLAGDPPIEVEVRNCRLSPRSASAEHIFVILALAALHRIGIRPPAQRNDWLRSLLNAEFIGDIRGGDSFSDIYGLRPFVEGSLPLLSAITLGRPFTMLPQTYGPFRFRASRWLAGFILRRATVVLTRDRSCIVTVRQLSGKLAVWCPDVAFTLSPTKPKAMAFSPENFDVKSCPLLVGINVSGLLYMGGYTGRNMFGLLSDYRAVMDQLVDRLLTGTAAKIVLVPHTFGSEREEEACAAILETAQSRHPGRVFMLTTALRESEVKWLIGQTDFFIGSRMHACIAALSQSVPAVGLAYSDKFHGVFDDAGVAESVIDLRSTETAQIVDRVMSAFQRRAIVAEKLQQRVTELQQDILTVFRGLLAP